MAQGCIVIDHWSPYAKPYADMHAFQLHIYQNAIFPAPPKLA